MICTHFKVIQQACSQHGFEIGQADWVRLLCTECKEHEVCPAADLSEDPAGELDVDSESVTLVDGIAPRDVRSQSHTPHHPNRREG